MAESERAKLSENIISCVKNDTPTNVECPVCLQTCVHPAELPCGHIFCYLCIKGIVNQGRRCAMCRQDIPVDYLDTPRLLNTIQFFSRGFEDGHLWFYEGHNGWWQYDERTSEELESVYQEGKRRCELLIAGFLYIADFDAMLQYRQNDPSRRRRIKRDFATIAKKGVAGLKMTWNMSATDADVNSSEPIQNLSNPSTPVSSDLTSERSLSGSNFISSGHEPIAPVESDGVLRHRNLPTPSINSNIDNPTEDNILYSRDSDLDSIIDDTLDWTTEQIESFNVGLLNDYEVLSRDLNFYVQLQGNINENISGRRPSNYITQYLNLSNPLSEPVENELETNQTNTSNHLERVSPSEESPPHEVNPIASNINEIESVTSTLPCIIPPPRSRGLAQLRATCSPRRESSLHEVNLATSNTNDGSVISTLPRITPPPRTRVTQPRARRGFPRRSSSLTNETLF